MRPLTSAEGRSCCAGTLERISGFVSARESDDTSVRELVELQDAQKCACRQSHPWALAKPPHGAGKSTAQVLAKPPPSANRQLGWAAERARLHHYRTRDGIEVDAVLEAADGRVVGIEVKSAETVRAEDLAGLRHLSAKVPQRFHHGIVLYAGSRTLPFGERLTAAPIDSLWRTQRT